ncbi:MAG: metal-dependent transcriptional regulator [Microcella sp.]|uniref:metal-dependent transcriptional regulator n=1 Tax=Microcella sp. TaxID=1913979 RepID=UPI00331610FF
MNGSSTSVAIDDYLKVIYAHTEWQPEPITPSQLAARLGLAPSSVTEMVKKLAASGLVDHQPYSAIRLTVHGQDRAVAMVRRHRLIETWLVRVFGYRWDEVHDEAEVLEHALSDRLLEAIDAQLGHPRRDPHGDIIPSADGTVRRPPAVRLDEARPGLDGTIVRISDRDPDVLRVIDRLGLALDEAITVEAGESPGAGVGVRRRGGSVIVLAPSIAAAVWVAAAGEPTA